MREFTTSLNADEKMNAQLHSSIFSVKSGNRDIEKYNQALVEAAASFAPNTLSLVIAAGADVNWKDIHGNSALSRSLLRFAAISLSNNICAKKMANFLDVVKMLITAGAKPTTQVNDIYMSKKKFRNCLSFVIENPDFRINNADGATLRKLLKFEV